MWNNHSFMDLPVFSPRRILGALSCWRLFSNHTVTKLFWELRWHARPRAQLRNKAQ